MAQAVPKKLLATGGIRTVDENTDCVRLFIFPPSFNSAKGVGCLRISSAWEDAEVTEINISSQNYAPDYCRLNPNMTVPTFEVDDKIITDSLECTKYLFDKYPGKGDEQAKASGKGQEVLEFCTLVSVWDEYMFTYGNMKDGMGDMTNEIRLLNIRNYLKEVLDESPEDRDTLVTAYVEKIARVTVMMKKTANNRDAEQKAKDLEENKRVFISIFAKAEGLLKGKDQGFLFSANVSSADIYLLAILRILYLLYPDKLEEVNEEYPSVKSYWERALATVEVQEGLISWVKKPHIAYVAFSTGLVSDVVKYKLGLKWDVELPADIEARLGEAIREEMVSFGIEEEEEEESTENAC